MRRTKIIATYGPSVSDPSVLLELAKRIDVLRINFSHNNEDSWAKMKKTVLAAIKGSGHTVRLLADLPGPKIRTGILPKPIPVKVGTKVCFSCDPKDIDSIPVSYVDLYKDAKPGAEIIIGDGKPRFKVEKITGKKIYCCATTDGEVLSKKGVDLSGATISLPTPTEVDARLAKFVKKEGCFDYVALSFVKSADDVKRLKKIVGSIPIISKIERQEAVLKIDSIAEVSDMLMVARGDLGTNLPIEKVPAAQREIIKSAKRNKKPVIVATQVLTTMIENPIPTRAEVNDIANSVINGADFIMLSDETTVGKYPIITVGILSKVIEETEQSIR